MTNEQIAAKLDDAIKGAAIPEGKTPLEFHTHAAQVSADAARILDKAAELIIADGGENAGDRAAELLGFSLEGYEYVVAADSAKTEMLYAMLKGNKLETPDAEAAQLRETAEHLRGIAAAEQRYVDGLNNATPAVVSEEN